MNPTGARKKSKIINERCSSISPFVTVGCNANCDRWRTAVCFFFFFWILGNQVCMVDLHVEIKPVSVSFVKLWTLDDARSVH